MEPPEDIRKLNEEIRELDLKIEGAIRIEAFSQAGVWKREQDELLKKLAQKKARIEKKNALRRQEVTENDIAGVVAMWTKIPVSKLEEKESERLLKLESILHKRVIGQDEAVSAVARAMRRGRVGLPGSQKAHRIFPVPGAYGRWENRTEQGAGRGYVRIGKCVDPDRYVRIYGGTFRFQADRFPSGICWL